MPGRTHRKVPQVPSGEHTASNHPSQPQLFHKLETEYIYRNLRERPKIEGTAPHEHQGANPTALDVTRAEPARDTEAEEGTAPRLPQAGAQPRAGRAKGRATAAPSRRPDGGLRQGGPPSPLDPHPRQPLPVSAGRGPRPVPAHGSPGQHRPGPTAGSRRSLPPVAAPLSVAAATSSTAVVYGPPAPSPPPVPCRLCPWLQLGWAAALIRAAEAPSCLLHCARSPHRDRRVPAHAQGGAGTAHSYHGNRARLRHGRGRGGEGGRGTAAGRGRRGGIIWDGSRAGPSRVERLLGRAVLEII